LRASVLLAGVLCRQVGVTMSFSSCRGCRSARVAALGRTPNRVGTSVSAWSAVLTARGRRHRWAAGAVLLSAIGRVRASARSLVHVDRTTSKASSGNWRWRCAVGQDRFLGSSGRCQRDPRPPWSSIRVGERLIYHASVSGKNSWWWNKDNKHRECDLKCRRTGGGTETSTGGLGTSTEETEKKKEKRKPTQETKKKRNSPEQGAGLLRTRGEKKRKKKKKKEGGKGKEKENPPHAATQAPADEARARSGHEDGAIVGGRSPPSTPPLR